MEMDQTNHRTDLPPSDCLSNFLIPAKVSTQEQFKNVTVNTSLVDLAQEGLSTADVTASGLQTEFQLNSPQLRQVIKRNAWRGFG